MTAELPSGWVKTTLGEIVRTKSGNSKLIKGQLAASYQSGLVPAYSASGQDVWCDKAEWGRPGVVLSAVGARCGKTFLALGNWTAIANTHVLIPGDGINPKWLWYLTNDENFWIKGGSAQPFVAMKASKEIQVLLPPPGEQKRIISAIEEHLSSLDAVDSALEMAKRRSAHLLECALQAGIRQYPAQESSLASFLTQKLSNGRSVPTANGDGSPVLRLTCLQSGLVNTDETKLGDFSGVDPEKYQIEPDDFLISRGNGSLRLVGIGGLVSDNAPPVAFPDTLIRARVDRKRLRPEFLRLVWNSKFVRRQLEPQARTTAGIYKVNQTMIGKVSFPTPSPEDQDRLVHELDQVREVVAGLEAEVSLAQERSRSLRRSILAEAFSGQLVPQNSNDEPAYAMLERIARSR